MSTAAIQRRPPPPPPPASADDPVPSGVRVGDYVITRRLGEGGMGVVYEALQPVIGKRVAIKVLRPERAADPSAAEEIVKEARAVATVHHRGVIDIYNVGRLPDGRAYLVMELLEGQPLDTWVAQHGSLTFAETCFTLEEVLEALAAVHAAGLAHRDLKPANVFRVTPSAGEPYLKLVDFGLAQRPTTTFEEMVVGTPSYMAPEQLRGSPATVATDLYSIGVIAYELITGARSLGDNPEQVLREHRKRARAARQVKPPELGRLLARLLAEEPGRRPLSAHAVLQEIRGLRRRSTVRSGVRASGRESSWASRLLRGLRGWMSPPVAPSTAIPKRSPGHAPPEAPCSTVELSLQDLGIVEAVETPVIDPARLARLTDAALDHLLTLDRLPPFPVSAMRVVHLVRGPHPEPLELTRLVSQDPALAAQVVRRANSAFSTRGIEIKGVRDAIVRLGMSDVAEVAAAMATTSLFPPGQGGTGDLHEARRRLAVHALSSAMGASWLALEYRKGDSERAFLGGLLHDIGKALVVSSLGDPALLRRLEGFDLAVQLEPLLEALHVDLGVLMAEEWKLPAHVVTICRQHHLLTDDPHAPIELHLVRLSSAVIDMKTNRRFPSARVDELRQSAKALGLDRHQLRAASTQMAEFVAKAEKQVREIGVE